MAKVGIIRSPFFYVGDKYKLMPQLKQLMPENINDHIEPFVGGGSSFLNSKGQKFILNDVDMYVIKLHKELCIFLDEFDAKGVKFGIKNLIKYKGNTNMTFSRCKERQEKYCFNICSTKNS